MAHAEALPARAPGRITTLEQAKAHRVYALTILTIMYGINFIDRQILVILQEPIKAELGLLDTQLGLLTGTLFVLTYAFGGIFIAHIADRHDRRTVIAVSMTVWSGFTALSGMATSFLHLAAARIGVGVGEAGASPPSHSIISDLYPKKERGGAMSIYSSGIYLGYFVGFLAGSWIAQFFGWRLAFFAIGIPGVLFAIWLRMTLKEPVRGLADGKPPPPHGNFFDAMRFLWSIKAFRFYSVATALGAFVSYGLGNFVPSFYVRTHEMSVAEVGTWLGFLQGGGGMAGTALGGIIADRLGRNNRRWYLYVPMWGKLVALPFALAAFAVPNVYVSLTCWSLTVFFAAMYLGPALALTHGLAPPNYRAISSAVLFFILNIVGLGLGPTIAGAISDILNAQGFGDDSLRWSLFIVSFLAIPGIILWIVAAKFITKNDDEAEAPASAAAPPAQPERA